MSEATKKAILEREARSRGEPLTKPKKKKAKAETAPVVVEEPAE